MPVRRSRWPATERGIRTSAYAEPAPATLRHWAQVTPEGFRFALKEPRSITNERLLKEGTVNEYKPKIGCWSASSLAASVHNPRDLISGRPLGPSDGPTLNRGLQLLREGKFDPKIEPEGTGTKFSTEK